MSTPHKSVTIRMIGRVPSPEWMPLIVVLKSHGCPQDLAYRNSTQLFINGERITGVLTSVDLVRLKADLLKLGIALEVLP